MNRIKAKEIAKELGISPATVSLALNDRPGVSKETKERVLDYLEQKENEIWLNRMQQKPSPNGAVLVLNYIKDGDIMDQRERYQWQRDGGQSPLIKKMAETVIMKGYQFQYRIFREKLHSLEHLISDCERLQVRGIYILAAEMQQGDIYPFQSLKIPIVTGDNLFQADGIDSYLIDNREGIARCVDYLTDKGHYHIVYLAENIEIFNFSERREAFMQEMAKRGLGDASNRIWYLGSNIQEVYESMKRHLDQGIRSTTAFVLESSVVSLGACKALMERQIRIPRDISLIGFDALPPSSLQGFDLTLIKGTHTRRHLAGVKHLIRHMEDENEDVMNVYYRTRLLEGNSVFDKTKYIYK